MWKSFPGPGALSVLCFSFCVRRCVGALQVTTNITGSELHYKERLLIEWSGDSSSSHDVGVQKQSDGEKGSFVMLSGGNTGSSTDWDFGYDFDVGTYAFVVRSGETEAQSPLYTLLGSQTTTSTATSSSATSSSSSTPTTLPTTSSTSASASSPTTTALTAASSGAGNSAGLSTGAAIGVGVGVGVVSIVLLGALLMWIYRRGKKAAATQLLESKQDPGQGGFSGHRGDSAETGPLSSASSRGPQLGATAPSYEPEAELTSNGSHDYYAELHHAPMPSEIGGAPRSELHSESMVKAELPPDAEVRRAKGRPW